MDINVIILELINAIIDYDYYDSLASHEISKRAGSFDKLNKIREKSGQNVAKIFPDTKFHDGRGHLLAFSKLKVIVLKQIEPLSKKDLKDYLGILQNDARKVAKLYKDISK